MTRHIAERQAAIPIVGLLSFAALSAHAQIDAGASGAISPTAPTLDASASRDVGGLRGPSTGFSVSSGVSLSGTYTDNSNLSATDKRSDFITQVSPSISIRSNAGRVRGSLDYSLTAIQYARGTESSRLLNNLAAALQAEAIENFAFVDFNAGISRQNISPLGQQSPDQNRETSNQTEVRSVSISPYVRGSLSGAVNYEARVTYATSHSGTDSLGNSINGGASLHLGSDGRSKLDWAIDGYSQSSDYSKGRRTETQAGIGSLLYSINGDVRLSVHGGREYNNVLTADKEGSNTYGGGLRWTPSQRTALSAQFDKRYFGNAHSIFFEHRTPQTVWNYVNSRNVSSDAMGASRQQPLNEFQLLDLQLTSKYPDPVERSRQALLLLLLQGKNPLAPAPGGFITSAVSLQRNQVLSFGYIGSRTTVLVSAQQSDSHRLDDQSNASDALSNGNSIKQRSFSVGASHRLTPSTSASLNVSKSSTSDTLAGGKVDLLSFTASYYDQIASRTSVSLSARRNISSGDSSALGSGYTESALIATLTFQF
ncbi:MAG: TIGR03016 family PEP-CTERM system-associated outer membrane protein [Rhizobacter sp.]|nr:TIGR03016 family PEP-CTERM system-associated outer membrane protein [Rhizobacter sp.]